MVSKPILYFILKMTAVTASFLTVDYAEADMVLWIISALSFACIFVLELLLYHLPAGKNIIIITNLLSVLACLFIGTDLLFPLLVMLIFHLADHMLAVRMFYYIFFISVLLSFIVFTPGSTAVVVSLCLTVMALFCRLLLIKMASYIEIKDKQKAALLDMENKVKDLKGLIKTLKSSVSMEERNRIAARIHDQIGHGISGSIILLEAAMLIMKDDPLKASESIGKAIKNLREGVDEIRSALREERAGIYELGINGLTSILEEFKINYNKSTRLKSSGDLNNMSIDVWSCVHDNLKECLTNLLKHSNATEFQLSIDVFKKIIKVEYKDNGNSEEGFEKDLGLEAIEERTVNAKGRCFFTKDENGFCVTNIFSY